MTHALLLALAHAPSARRRPLLSAALALLCCAGFSGVDVEATSYDQLDPAAQLPLSGG